MDGLYYHHGKFLNAVPGSIYQLGPWPRRRLMPSFLVRSNCFCLLRSSLSALRFAAASANQQGSLWALLGLLKRLSYACTSVHEYIKYHLLTAFCFRNSSYSNLYCASSSSRKFFSRRRILYNSDVSVTNNKYNRNNNNKNEVLLPPPPLLPPLLCYAVLLLQLLLLLCATTVTTNYFYC